MANLAYRVTFQLEEVEVITGKVRPLSSSSQTFPSAEMDMVALTALLQVKLSTFQGIVKSIK